MWGQEKGVRTLPSSPQVLSLRLPGGIPCRAPVSSPTHGERCWKTRSASAQLGVTAHAQEQRCHSLLRLRRPENAAPRAMARRHLLPAASRPRLRVRKKIRPTSRAAATRYTTGATMTTASKRDRRVNAEARDLPSPAQRPCDPSRFPF